MAWTYSDYVTYDYGSSRLSRFRLHLQEVMDALTAEVSANGRSKSTETIGEYLTNLQKREDAEIAQCKRAAGSTPAFTRGRMLL